MLVQWCLRGVGMAAGFGDAEAQALLSDGLPSAWLRSLRPNPATAVDAFVAANGVLSATALDAHVNGFATAGATSPYISLSAGCVEPDGQGGTIRHSAMTTALLFATDWGRRDGYVLKCWLLVGPKPVPELPGFGEEVRDLNASAQFATFHHEGEIAAKVIVPARQILSLRKYDQHWNEIADSTFPILQNPDFVPPERITALRELVL